MDNGVKRYLLVALLFVTMLASQLACDEGSTTGCKSTACRDSCGGDNACRIECCNGTRVSWTY